MCLVPVGFWTGLTVTFAAEEQSALQRSPSQQCRHTPGKSRFRPTTGPVKWGRQPYIQHFLINKAKEYICFCKLQIFSQEIERNFNTISDSHLDVKYFFPKIVFSCMKHFYKKILKFISMEISSFTIAKVYLVAMD